MCLWLLHISGSVFLFEGLTSLLLVFLNEFHIKLIPLESILCQGVMSKTVQILINQTVIWIAQG